VKKKIRPSGKTHISSKEAIIPESVGLSYSHKNVHFSCGSLNMGYTSSKFNLFPGITKSKKEQESASPAVKMSFYDWLCLIRQFWPCIEPLIACLLWLVRYSSKC